MALKECLEICNIKLDADMGQPSSLPVKMGALGIMNATVINSAAYLSSVNKCKELMGKKAGDASTSLSEEAYGTGDRDRPMRSQLTDNVISKSHGYNQFSETQRTHS